MRLWRIVSGNWLWIIGGFALVIAHLERTGQLELQRRETFSGRYKIDRTQIVLGSTFMADHSEIIFTPSGKMRLKMPNGSVTQADYIKDGCQIRIHKNANEWFEFNISDDLQTLEGPYGVRFRRQ